MSLILSIETATKVCSVALHNKGELILEENLFEEYSHFEKLPGLIHRIFTNTEYKMENLQAVAISKGPGSYTGLRIGVSMTKGMAFALGIPIVSVNTLKAMALSGVTAARGHDLICPMIDARRAEVYTLITNKKLEEIWPTQALIVNENTFDELLKKNNLILFGDGSTKFKSLFEKNDRIKFVDIFPSAVRVGELAWKKFQNKEFEDTAYFEPYYLKDYIPGISKKKLTL